MKLWELPWFVRNFSRLPTNPLNSSFVARWPWSLGGPLKHLIRDSQSISWFDCVALQVVSIYLTYRQRKYLGYKVLTIALLYYNFIFLWNIYTYITYLYLVRFEESCSRVSWVILVIRYSFIKHTLYEITKVRKMYSQHNFRYRDT